MQATLTAVGLDVHARSTHAAAIDVVTGELSRSRFGEDSEQVVRWLAELPGPVRAAYEAGPTGFGLARTARALGIEVLVAAPSRRSKRIGR
jgi:transposase